MSVNKVEYPDNHILQQDAEHICASKSIPWGILTNKSVLITGATGLIGSQIVKVLICYNRLNNGNIKVIALARNKEKAAKVFKDVLNDKNLNIVLQDILKPINTDIKADYIIHTASITDSKQFVDYPAETINICLEGTRNVLEFAENSKSEGMIYLSSMEIYGIPDDNLESVTEKDYGYLDHMDVRGSYPEGKRMAECMCSAYAKEKGVPVKVARLTQTFGAGVSYNDNRVFAQFARSILNKKDIVLHTKGETVRSYCYIRDAVTAILIILLKGESGNAYNVANPDTTISISDMAQMLVSKYPEADVKVKYEIEQDLTKHGYAPVFKMRLNVDKLKSLGWKPEADLSEMYDRMIKSLSLDKE